MQIEIEKDDTDRMLMNWIRKKIILNIEYSSG